MRTWAELSDIERRVMLLAEEESMLWEVCAALEPDCAKRASVVQVDQRVAETLARDGLLWFFWLNEGHQPLSEAEGVTLFNTPTDWLVDPDPDEDTDTPAQICLYPTEDGERLLSVDI